MPADPHFVMLSVFLTANRQPLSPPFSMPFARILRSSALMGGAQAVTLAMAFLRSKLIAVLIGPSGIGLMGVFNAFNANVSTVAGWGLATSAVRVVAGAGDDERARKAAAVRKFGRRLAWCGLFGVLILVLPIGQLTFESQKYSLELLLAGLAVPCVIATTMWSSLLQAGGHVGSMARTQTASSIAGLLLGLPFIYLFGTVGIALSILLAALVTAYVTWQAASRLSPPGAEADGSAMRDLLHLGLILQIGSVLGAVSTYLVRVLILRSHGEDLPAGLADAGYYQAAFAITGSLPGVIFSVTNSDFYPRVAAAKDEEEARVITEKQVQASLLLAMPFLTALLALGPWAVRFLYAKGFEPAVPLLDWFTWSIFCNLLGWPLGFWVVARRSKRVVALFQALLSVATLLLAVFLVPAWGVKGAAIAFFGGALIYTLVLLVMTRWISGAWISAVTCDWVAVGMVVLLFATKAAMTVWGLGLVLAVSSGCLYAYLRIMRASKVDAS
jgi:antigen flippase